LNRLSILNLSKAKAKMLRRWKRQGSNLTPPRSAWTGSLPLLDDVLLLESMHQWTQQVLHGLTVEELAFLSVSPELVSEVIP